MKASALRSTLRVFNSVFVLCLLSAEMVRAGNLFTGPINSPAGRYPWALAAGDFNHDGKIDVAVTKNKPFGNDSQVKVLLGEGIGIFEPPVGYHVGAEPRSVAVGDFNRDGSLDLAVISFGSSPKLLGVLLGNGDGTFQPQVRYKVGLEPAQVVAGDFNGDGNLDLAVTNRNTPGFVSLLLGIGDGTFQPQIKTAIAHYPNLIAVGDLNGDGKLDLVTASGGCCPKKYTNALLGNGDGAFQLVWTTINAAVPAAIALGDFNGDSKLDLAETYLGTEMFIRLGNGDGTFQKALRSPTGSQAGLIAVADFDRDGKLDVAVTTIADFPSSMSVLLGKGNGFFKPPVNFLLTSAAMPKGIVAADVNGDGKPDLIVTDYFNKCVSVFLNTSP